MALALAPWCISSMRAASQISGNAVPIPAGSRYVGDWSPRHGKCWACLCIRLCSPVT